MRKLRICNSLRGETGYSCLSGQSLCKDVLADFLTRKKSFDSAADRGSHFTCNERYSLQVTYRTEQSASERKLLANIKCLARWAAFSSIASRVEMFFSVWKPGWTGWKRCSPLGGNVFSSRQKICGKDVLFTTQKCSFS